MTEALNNTPAPRGRAQLLALHAESGVHAGTGSTISHLDLPIQRENFTKLPIFQASTVKGALREHFESLAASVTAAGEGTRQAAEKQVDAFFGPERGDLTAGMGLIQEGRLLLLPIRSRVSVYAMVTCPLQLQRLKRDVAGILPYLNDETRASAERFLGLAVPEPGESQAAVVASSPLQAQSTGHIFLEDYRFQVLAPFESSCDALALWFSEWLYGSAQPADLTDQYFKSRFATHFAILSNDDFLAFAEMHLPIETHIQLNEGGTVAFGPWNEEFLPPDSVVSLAVVMPEPLTGVPGTAVFPDSDAMNTYFAAGVCTGTRIRLGGGRSLGKGLLRSALLGGTIGLATNGEPTC
ncbi:type III-B CRISPR module RAMP protein Cmr4 [Paludibaculum fermentans]|uniref:type III-B CRISPR module RAMP protein Cmr4 n=1 Tax=Paludibaculum fermentans TaxID=1473598 RepID=UPI003EC08CD9